MLSGAALAVVLIADDHPLDALGLVVTAGGWHRAVLASRLRTQMVSGSPTHHITAIPSKLAAQARHQPACLGKHNDAFNTPPRLACGTVSHWADGRHHQIWLAGWSRGSLMQEAKEKLQQGWTALTESLRASHLS